MEEVEAGLTLFLDMPNLLYLKAKEKKKHLSQRQSLQGFDIFQLKAAKLAHSMGITVYPPLYL